ncbi:hypothetical protein CSUI_005718, partial [Cystoisospora suis]
MEEREVKKNSQDSECLRGEEEKERTRKRRKTGQNEEEDQDKEVSSDGERKVYSHRGKKKEEKEEKIKGECLARKISSLSPLLAVSSCGVCSSLYRRNRNFFSPSSASSSSHSTSSSSSSPGLWRKCVCEPLYMNELGTFSSLKISSSNLTTRPSKSPLLPSTLPSHDPVIYPSTSSSSSSSFGLEMNDEEKHLSQEGRPDFPSGSEVSLLHTLRPSSKSFPEQFFPSSSSSRKCSLHCFPSSSSLSSRRESREAEREGGEREEEHETEERENEEEEEKKKKKIGEMRGMNETGAAVIVKNLRILTGQVWKEDDEDEGDEKIDQHRCACGVDTPETEDVIKEKKEQKDREKRRKKKNEREEEEEVDQDEERERTGVLINVSSSTTHSGEIEKKKKENETASCRYIRSEEMRETPYEERDQKKKTEKRKKKPSVFVGLCTSKLLSRTTNLSLQCGAEEKVKRYECLVYTNFPVGQKDLNHLREKVT